MPFDNVQRQQYFNAPMEKNIKHDATIIMTGHAHVFVFSFCHSWLLEISFRFMDGELLQKTGSTLLRSYRNQRYRYNMLFKEISQLPIYLNISISQVSTIIQGVLRKYFNCQLLGPQLFFSKVPIVSDAVCNAAMEPQGFHFSV